LLLIDKKLYRFKILLTIEIILLIKNVNGTFWCGKK